MNRKTTILIVFLFLVTCGLLYVALVATPYKKSTVSAPTPTPMSVNAHTLLGISPASASQVSQSKQYTLAVTIDTGVNPVNSVQLELAYDPQALTNVTATPGDFFVQPSPLVNNINTVDGRISYALAEQIDLPGKKGSGTIALISFDIAPSFTGRTTTITFLPKSAVAADRIMESVLRKTTNYTFAVVKPTGASTTGSAPTLQPLPSVTQPAQ